MRLLVICYLIICYGTLSAQTNSDKLIKNTLLAKLNTNDSLIYYQCRATTAAIEIKTGNQKIESKEQHISITEKFVIIHTSTNYLIRYFTSGMTILPNRKFSGLKLREKSYWEFKFKSERALTDEELAFLSGLQSAGKETTEYDFTISKYTTNQIIIKKQKDFEQLLIKDKLSISEALKL